MVDPRWVLSLMMAAQATHPWKAEYERSASAIAKAATRFSAFQGANGPERTAAVLVAIGAFESGLRPDAKGDCDKTDPKTHMCMPGAKPSSFCMFQINESNFKAYRTYQDEILANMDVCASVAAQMIQQSFRTCSYRPLEERLVWYTRGQASCDVLPTSGAANKSRHRMFLGMKLFTTHPPTGMVESDNADDIQLMPSVR